MRPTRRGPPSRSGKLVAKETDIPAGVLNVIASSDNNVGAAAHDASRCGCRVVHGVDAGRAPDHGGGERNRETRVPRARGKDGVRHARRRRPEHGRNVLRVRGRVALGAGLRDHVAPCRAARPLRRSRRHRFRHARRRQIRRPVRP